MAGSAVGKWLSKPAVLWALYEAPDVPARLVSTLVAVAAHAGEDGRGAYPSGASVAMATRKSESQAKRDIAELARRGLLLPGDPRIVADIRADRRPAVYDLPMPRGASGRSPLDGSRGASGNRTGRSSLQNGDRPDAPEEFLKNSGRRARDSAGAQSPPASQYRAPPCPVCGKPFSQQQLADPEFREMALAGAVIHDECTGEDHRRYIASVSIAQLLEDGYYDEAVARDPAAVRAILGEAP